MTVNTDGDNFRLMPNNWARMKGIVIVNPDGWRTDSELGAKEYTAPITEAEFDKRAQQSTIRTVGKRGSGRVADTDNHRGNGEDSNNPVVVDGGGNAAWQRFLDELETITKDTLAALRKIEPSEQVQVELSWTQHTSNASVLAKRTDTSNALSAVHMHPVGAPCIVGCVFRD